MANLPSVSLRAWPANDPSKETLPFIIARINQERGSFRNVTEELLEEEIKALKTHKFDREEEIAVSQPIGTQDAKSRSEEVSLAREEILKHTELAWNESALTLDFVSAVLSRHTPRQAELTLSPFLKQSLPMGSLGAEIVQLPQKPQSDKIHDDLVTSGWKLQSLSSAADALLTSATRLEQEIKRETIYWGQVLGVKEQAWSLHRLPRERHTLGVRYGFSEAHPDFRDRGLAALRRDDEGNISLDLGSRSSGNRALRVRILQDGLPVASHFRTLERNDTQTPVVQRLLQARDSIYDEELHHELHREARNYMNQGVRCIDSKILIPYETGKEVEIDLVSSVDEEFVNDDLICKSIALSLRILLSSAHRQNLRQRSQIPSPLREGKNPLQVYTILRPILEYLQHQSQIQKITTILNVVAEIFSRASLPLDVKEPEPSYYFTRLPPDTNLETLAPTERLVRLLTAPFESSIMVLLPSQSTTLKIEAHTSLQPPFLGTEWRCTIIDPASTSLIANMPTSGRFPSLEALEDYLLHLMELELASWLLSDERIGKGWKVTSLYACRLGRRLQEPAISQTIVVSIRKNQLRLRWEFCSSGFKAEGTEIWDDSRMEGKGLVETIQGVLSEARPGLDKI